MLRLLVAGIAGLVLFIPIFWLATWVTGDNNVGAWSALPVAFIGIPALVLKLWRGPANESKAPRTASRRNRILGAVGMVWGGLIVVFGLAQGVEVQSGAETQGRASGLVFGGLMFVVGLYYFIKGGRETQGKGAAVPHRE